MLEFRRKRSMANENDVTLSSYAEKFREYDTRSSQIVAGATKEWIDRALTDIPKNASIFEIGTAHARDAKYISAMGYDITCSDAIEEFVSEIRNKGFQVIKFNVINDKYLEFYDIIIANAVMPHFNNDEFDIVLRKTINALKPGGRFAFTIKAGQGSEWSNDKIEAPRFFRYWSKQEIIHKLYDHSVTDFDIVEAHTDRAHADWIYIIFNRPN